MYNKVLLLEFCRIFCDFAIDASVSELYTNLVPPRMIGQPDALMVEGRARFQMLISLRVLEIPGVTFASADN